MRRSAISSAAREEESEINLTPMLDVVFIMLIFFIVTANFIKEPGLEVNRPDSDTSEIQENAAILIAVGGNDEIYMDLAPEIPKPQQIGLFVFLTWILGCGRVCNKFVAQS